MFLTNGNHSRVSPLRRLALLLALAVSTAAHAQAPPPILGDVNGDGNIDVLDIQGAANMALGSADTTPPADVDENASINILDVQVLTNTALGVGGLVQPVVGTFAPVSAAKGVGTVKAVAISTDGRKIEADVDPSTGTFELTLPVRTSWSIGFIGTGSETDTLGTVTFPIADERASSIPLPGLSDGNIIDLGSITAGLAAETDSDMRTLLAERSDPLDVADNDGNGVSDLFQGLLLPYPWQVEGSGIRIPDGLDINVLQAGVDECLRASLQYISLPDLTGIEVAGVPAFVAPMLYCFTQELYQWLDDSDLNALQIANRIYQISAAITPRIKPWLAELNIPELTDANGNHVPDYIENLYCQEDAAKVDACQLDVNGNGVPDFAEDDDGDNTPNYLDVDSHTEQDGDGDGIENNDDLDDDNDGQLDYADESPVGQ